MNAKMEIPKPDIFQAKRILAVQPHYDDNDIPAGGTLALLADGGAELIYLTATDDLVGVVDPEISDDEAAAQLKQEQLEAGEIIGVKEHYWLGYPDAGDYDYFDLRRDIIRHIRALRPDFLVTCDPWLPYEAHLDHIQVGRAVSEASYLHTMTRLPTDPEVDAGYEPYEIEGIAFYGSHRPNTVVDITSTRERKHRAFDHYRAQFSPESMERLHYYVDLKEQEYAEGHDFSHAERFKVLRIGQLHGDTEAWRT
jgi:LmbE family N-acetylglucosaminyl deacetylase